MTYDTLTIVDHGDKRRPYLGDHESDVRDAESDTFVDLVDLPREMEPIEVHEHLVDNPTFLQDVLDEDGYEDFLAESIEDVRDHNE